MIPHGKQGLQNQHAITQPTHPSRSTIHAYYRLMKPTVMQLVVFTALVGMALAGTVVPAPNPWIQIFYLFLIAMGAGGAGATNMGYEQDIDSRMYRTQHRPTVTGEISKHQAITFGLILGMLSTVGLGITANVWAGALMGFTLIFYAGFYTMYLKPRTPQNIVIGGAAGALPPIIGWMCLSPEFHPLPFMMFCIIFLWTPPHFWALTLYCNEDYKRSRLPMLVVTHGTHVTRRWILRYTYALGSAVFMPFLLGFTGYIYLILAGVYHGYFHFLVHMLYTRRTIKSARDVFRGSLVYLFIIFLAMALDRLIPAHL